MKASLAQRIVNATLLLAPIVGAFVAAAAARATEPGQIVRITTIDPGATEAGHPATLMVTREGAAVAQPLVVPIKLSGTAKAGTDYVSVGSITFPAQTPLAVVKITPMADALPEGTETVVVTLVPNSNYTLGVARHDAVSAPPTRRSEHTL